MNVLVDALVRLWYAFWRAIVSVFSSTPALTQDRTRRLPLRVNVARCAEVTADPPPMHWAPCHPSSVKRFKASMTCPNGHSLTLKSHTVTVQGEVMPSVVCPVHTCTFHDWVRLTDWTFGSL
jgi:hypothetical protein